MRGRKIQNICPIRGPDDGVMWLEVRYTPRLWATEEFQRNQIHPSQTGKIKFISVMLTTRGGTHQPGHQGNYQEACRASLHQQVAYQNMWKIFIILLYYLSGSTLARFGGWLVCAGCWWPASTAPTSRSTSTAAAGLHSSAGIPNSCGCSCSCCSIESMESDW